MTRNEFLALCGEYLIDPGMALENEAIHAALRDKLPERDLRVLFETEF